MTEFAERLQELKEGTGRSYKAIALRVGVSSSALQRYCRGVSVPPRFAVVERFGAVCGADREQLRELHRLWVLADAGQRNAVAVPAGGVVVVSPGAALSDTALRMAVSGPRILSVKPPRPDEGAAVEPAEELEGGSGNGLPVGPSRQAADTTVGTREPLGLGRISALRLRRSAYAVAVTLVLVAGLAGIRGVWITTNGEASGGLTGESRILFSKACESVVAMGQHDDCVLEVQTLLSQAGARLSVDSSFGPETLRRVTAFQVMAGLPPKGVVDDETKKALYAGKVEMKAWNTEQVEQRIREIFTEQPDRAVAIARCQSFLDPLHILSNSNGTRNWGVFQLSDPRLRDFGGTPLRALDPDWNIQMAHQLWLQQGDFSDWPHCNAALETSSAAPDQV